MAPHPDVREFAPNFTATMHYAQSFFRDLGSHALALLGCRRRCGLLIAVAYGLVNPCFAGMVFRERHFSGIGMVVGHAL